MKTLLAILILSLSSQADADSFNIEERQAKPAESVTFKNKAGGEIVFTPFRGKCDEGSLASYIREKSGQISLWGCWVFDSSANAIFVNWNDGTSYSYK